MKKIILSALTVGFLFVSGAAIAQVTYGPKLALNVSSIHDKSNDGSYTADTHYESKIGYQIGGMLNAQITDYFAIRPELTFNNIGSKYAKSGITATFNTNYLMLPVNFVGQYPISDNFKLQGFIGGYAALGVGGKFKYDSPIGSGSEKINMKKDPGNNNNMYQNPWDFGMNFGIGFQAKAFVFSASYSLGLSNLESHYSNSTDESNRGKYNKTTNRNISFGVAYLFGGK